MRNFEITLAFILALQLLLPFFLQGQINNLISVITIVLSAIHFGIEGYRWQMIPMYLVVIYLISQWILPLIINKTYLKVRLFGSKLSFGIGFTLLIISIFPPILLPIPKTPEPTGPFEVGTRSMMLIDKNRYEIYSEKNNQPRKLMIQIWYPADVSQHGQVTNWMHNIEVMGPAISRYLGLPDFFLDHLKYAQGHSYSGEPVSKKLGSYPVLLFSHGWNGFRSQNTFQVEELASHGFIVIAPDHTFGSVASVFPDGTIAYNNPKALPTGMDIPDGQFDFAAHVLGQQWASDLSFILDYLSIENNVDLGIDSNRLDFNRIGAFGHSTGGGAAIQFCGQDPRCIAVMGMDPYMDPVSTQLLESGLDIPVVTIFSEAWTQRGGGNAIKFNELDSHSSNNIYNYWIKDTTHFDFSDLPAFSPLAHALGLKGEINGHRVLRIINAYTLDFFDHYLKGNEFKYLDQDNSSYPEVIQN